MSKEVRRETPRLLWWKGRFLQKSWLSQGSLDEDGLLQGARHLAWNSPTCSDFFDDLYGKVPNFGSPVEP